MNDANFPDEVIRLASRGDGLTASGRHVKGAVPGDLVAQDGAIQPGPNHLVPACRHFGSCGGCQLQHVAEPLLADFYVDRILSPLARVGIVPKAVQPVAFSPVGSRRRASLRATLRDGRVRLGFNAEGSHDLVDIHECPVLRPRLFALIAPLRALLKPHLAERSAIAITLTDTDQGVDLLLSNLQANRLPVIAGLTQFAADHALARLSVEGPDGVETLALHAEPAVLMGGVRVTLPPAAFLQATAEGEAALVEAVTGITGDARRIADLFCGAGTFALPLSRTAEVLAADAAGPAVKALEAAARQSGRRLTAAHRDLFRRPFTAAELERFDAIVFDPPRAGAIAQSAEIAASRVPRVAAVSCNPATFARDAERLVAGGYRLERLWPVAQFHWSTHVELVAEFRR